MQPVRSLSKALLACLLTGCGASISDSPAPPPCASPVVLPERALNDQEIEVFWGRDRSALRECGTRLEVAAGRAD